MGINDALLKSIQTIVNNAIEVAPFNKTRQAQIVSNNGDGVYSVRLDGVLYDNVPTYPKNENIVIGSVCKLVIPNNQPIQMFIKSPTSLDLGKPIFYLNNYEVDGDVDKEIYDSIIALGWQDVLQ